MPGAIKKYHRALSSICLKRIPAFLHGRMFVALILVPFFSGCAAHNISMQPELKSTAKGDLNSYDRMKAANDAGETVSNLPEMNAGSHEALGDAMMAQGDFQSAYNHYKKALDMGAGSDRSRLEYKQGLAFLYAGKHDAAMSHFEAVLDHDPDYAAAYQGIGRIYLKRGDLEKAKAQFQRAVTLDSDLWQSQNYLGTIYDREGAWDEAVNAYKSALAVKPREGSVLNNLGTSYLLSGNNDLAAEMFELAIQDGFTENRVFNNLGLALARAGRFDEALQAFKTAVGEAAAYNNLGCVHLQDGRYRMAIECFEKAITLDPKFYVTASDNLKKASMSVNAGTGGIQ